jgi:outer membrane protein assembly factor BamB
VGLKEAVGGPADSAPIVGDGAVYLATYEYDLERQEPNSAFSAFDAATGEVRWTVAVDRLGYSGTPAVANGVVYLGTTTLEREEFFGPGTPITEPVDLGALVALDAATGEERWRYSLEGAGEFSPAVADGMVYVGAEDGILHAVDAATGEGRWTFAVWTAADIRSTSLAVADGTVYVASSRGFLFALDAATGEERWRAEIGGDGATTPVFADGTLYVSATDVPKEYGDETVDDKVGSLPPGIGRLYAFDATSGDERWTADVGVDPDRYLGLDQAVAGGLVYLVGFGEGGSNIQALDAATGEARWDTTLDTQVGTSPAVADGTLYIGGDAVYALDAASGEERWRVETGGYNGWTPFVADGAVFVASADGNLYAIGGTEAGAGTPAASPAPTGDVSGLPPCDVEPRPEAVLDAGATPPAGLDRLYEPPVAGTPVASVVPVTEAQEEGQPAAMRPEDVPDGEPADAEAVAGVTDTIKLLNACSRPGRERQIAALYSDDYFRRAAVATSFRYNGYRFFGWEDAPKILPVEDVRRLPDGRVGVLHQYSPEFAAFLVFVEQDGRWLIDEVVDVRDNPDARG